MDTARTDAADFQPSAVASFGALLRLYRLAAGLTQEALAERAGLSVQGLRALESGRRQAPYRSTVALLAHALDLAPAAAAALETAIARARPGSSGSRPHWPHSGRRPITRCPPQPLHWLAGITRSPACWDC